MIDMYRAPRGCRRISFPSARVPESLQQQGANDMNTENKLARLMRNSGPARVLVPIGIILIVFGIIMFLFRPAGELVETVGTVTSVTEATTDGDGKEYDVGFSYTVDGREYQNVFPNLTGTFSIGDAIKVFYDSENPGNVANTKNGGFIAPVLIILGVLAIAYGISRSARAFKKSADLDQTAPGAGAPPVDFHGFKTAPGVTEYYCRFDGNNLKPGYIIEDAARAVLFEGTMTKNALVGARTFTFTDHTTGSVKEHEVGHIVTESFNDEYFSASSSFKFDGKNIWDVLHERGLRLSTDLRSRFPNISYDVSRNGRPFARIEACSKYVHEDEEAQHKLVLPIGRYYYRFWTDSSDFETLFLTIFAVSESEQTIVE